MADNMNIDQHYLVATQMISDEGVFSQDQIGLLKCVLEICRQATHQAVKEAKDHASN